MARTRDEGRGQGTSLRSHGFPWSSGLVPRARTGLPGRSGEKEWAPASQRPPGDRRSLRGSVSAQLRHSWPIPALFSQGRQSWGGGANRPPGLEKVSDLPSPASLVNRYKDTGVPPAPYTEGLCAPNPAEAADQRRSGREASRHPLSGMETAPRGLGGSPGVHVPSPMSLLKASVFLPFLPASSWTKRGILRSQVCKSPLPPTVDFVPALVHGAPAQAPISSACTRVPVAAAPSGLPEASSLLWAGSLHS